MPVSEVKSAAQLKCMDTKAGCMCNKQDKLEAQVQQEGYDIVTITDTWWGASHNWSATMDRYSSSGETGE